MNLIEIVPAQSREHRREIRDMTRGTFWKGFMPMNPQLMALLEIGTGAAAGLLIGGVMFLFVRWWMCV